MHRAKVSVLEYTATLAVVTNITTSLGIKFLVLDIKLRLISRKYLMSLILLFKNPIRESCHGDGVEKSIATDNKSTRRRPLSKNSLQAIYADIIFPVTQISQTREPSTISDPQTISVRPILYLNLRFKQISLLLYFQHFKVTENNIQSSFIILSNITGILPVSNEVSSYWCASYVPS
ncbi:hypothetical protein AVEN_25526-1 [Araneus ventricosus]|uniref:Uncharacterized protein n=1 Tax=Araneus ventricosus TaxID=182803 RepID=A0A4Y2QE30_ARAVE|nr:hypothetical protein AVEN_25526-1 [Araneus ventricosus]